MATINGNNSDNAINGTTAAETINGLAGYDTIFGGAGNDSIDGGADNDTIGGDAGDDTVNGGDGFDTAVYDIAPSAVNVSLLTNTASGGDGNDTLISIEALVGSAYNDTLVGDNNDNDLAGGLGNDTLIGGGGADFLEGDAGSDSLDGGAGIDGAAYTAIAAAYTITQQGSNVIVSSADGTDTLSGIEHLIFTDAFYATTAQGTGLIAAQIVETVFGTAALADPALYGQYLALIEGGYTAEETVAAALASARFLTSAGTHSNSDFVNTVYHNVAGVYPDAGTHDSLTALLTTGVYTQAQLAVLATAYAATPNFLLAVTPQTLSIVTGTESADSSLVGTVAADFMSGRGGNDVFFSAGGNDIISGGAGIDRSVYATAKAGYTVTVNNLGLSVKDNASSDHDELQSVERLTFSDISVAYDIDGNAGIAAKIVGVMFGAAALQNEAVVGQYLAMLDSGMSYEAVSGAAAASALFASQAGGHSSAQFVDHVFFNLAGIHPDAHDLQIYVDLLDTQGYTQGHLGMLAADTIYNVSNVNLTGLAQTGLEYTPV